MVAKDPQVAHAVGVSRAIMATRDERVAPEGSLVTHSPVPLVAGIARPTYLELFRVPVRIRDNRGFVVFLHDVVAGGHDIKVEAPVRVVGMHVTGAGVKGACEPEPRSDAAVIAQPPVADVTIPTGCQLAYQPQLVPVVPERYTRKISTIDTTFENGLRWG